MAPPNMRSMGVMYSGSDAITCLMASLKLSFRAVSGAILTCAGGVVELSDATQQIQRCHRRSDELSCCDWHGGIRPHIVLRRK